MDNLAMAQPGVFRLQPRRIVSHWLGRAMAAILAGAERARQRRSLRELDDRLLRDVGLSRCDVAIECAKPFWRP